jgi:hypothetical protein
LTQRDSKINEKNKEIIPSSPSAFQRDINSIPANSDTLVDMTRDIVVRNKSLTQGQQNSIEGREIY